MSAPEQADAGGRLVAVPAMLGAIVSFQFGAAIAKSLFPVIGPAGTVGARVLLSTVILWIMLRPWRHWPDRNAWRVIIPYGLSVGVMNLLFYLAIERIALGPAVAVEFTGPLAVAFIGSRRLIDLLWAGLVVGGLALLLDPGASLHHSDPVGVLLALAAGLFWAIYILVGQRVGRLVPGGQGTALGLAVASIAIGPFCVGPMRPLLHDPKHLLAASLVAILSSALPFTLEMVAMRRMSTRAFGVLLSLDPALAALTGLLLLGEALPAIRWFAIACIVLASLGSTLSGEKQVLTEI